MKTYKTYIIGNPVNVMADCKEEAIINYAKHFSVPIKHLRADLLVDSHGRYESTLWKKEDGGTVLGTLTDLSQNTQVSYEEPLATIRIYN